MSGQAPAATTSNTAPPAGANGQSGQASDNPLPNLESVELTQEQFNELPEWARESLSKANKEAGGYRTKLRENETLITEAGGADRIKDLQWRTTTADGIKSLFEEMADLEGIEDILGVPQEQLKSLVGKATKAATKEAAATETATGVALKPEEVEQLVQKHVQEAVAGVEQKNTQTQLRSTVTSHLKAKGYTDDWSFGVITQMASKHQNDPDINMNSDDPMSPYIQALDKGIADFEEWKTTELAKSRDEYLNGKSDDASGTPRATTSSNPATGEKWSPGDLSWDELTQEAKKRGYFD